jgi:hypothetical protein
MGPRFLILLVVVAGMAVFLATRTAAPPVDNSPIQDAVLDPKERSGPALEIQKKMLCERELPGEQVEAAPTVQVEVDPTGKKNRLFFFVTEPNGYYVDGLSIRFYYKPTPDTTLEDSPFQWVEIINKYVKANEPLKSCLEVVSAELRFINGNIGRSENWAAEVVHYCHARTKNPEPLPELAEAMSCD